MFGYVRVVDQRQLRAARRLGGLAGWMVLTAKSPHAPSRGWRLAVGADLRQLAVGHGAGRLVERVGLSGIRRCASSDRVVAAGVRRRLCWCPGATRAAMSHWWLRNDPPKAAWKNWSAMT